MHVILSKIQLFNPVPVMKRVEVARSILTSDATIATLLSSVTSHRQWSIR
jgi:3-hydroxyacyl-CoA dehydrogenase